MTHGLKVGLHEKIGHIKSKSDLAEFIIALRSDLEKNPDEWENATLERFLAAMSDWVEAMDNCYKNTNQTPVDFPSWKTFGEILYAAKIYE